MLEKKPIQIWAQERLILFFLILAAHLQPKCPRFSFVERGARLGVDKEKSDFPFRIALGKLRDPIDIRDIRLFFIAINLALSDAMVFGEFALPVTIKEVVS